jgi:membrane protease YdiL (CAAX protease family)
MSIARILSPQKACSNCGLEQAGDVLVCAGCGTDLSVAGRCSADGVITAPCDAGNQMAVVPLSWKQKSLLIRILEWFLVLYALSESGVLNLGFYVYRHGLLSLTYSGDVSSWTHWILRNVGALGILGYVLFRNSRWCQAQPAYSTESEDALWKPEGAQSSKRDSRGVRIFELFLVLFVAFAGGIFSSFEVLLGHATIPDQPISYGPTRDVYVMLSFAAGVGLLSYVLSRRSRGFQDLGFRWASRDVAVALPLALGSGLAFRLLLPVTFGGAELMRGLPPQVADIGNYVYGTSISMAAVLNNILVGFFEELIVRGYLMTEVRRFTGSILFAIFCSVAVQTSYHFYQGGPVALAYVGGFMVFAAYYAQTNRILPVVLAHSAIDLNALVMHALSLARAA